MRKGRFQGLSFYSSVYLLVALAAVAVVSIVKTEVFAS